MTEQLSQPVERVRERFERDATGFDAIYRLERSPISRWLNVMFRKAVFRRYELTFEHAGNLAGKDVLDVGCGSGIYSADFARRGAAHVMGIDLSPNMLRLARGEAERHSVASKCEFVEGDFATMNFGDRRFDVSIAMGVYDYLPNPGPFLNKMAAVTKGTVLASFPGHSLIRKPLRRMRYRLTGRGDVYYYTREDVQRLANAAELLHSEIIPVSSSGGGFFLVGRH